MCCDTLSGLLLFTTFFRITEIIKACVLLFGKLQYFFLTVCSIFLESTAWFFSSYLIVNFEAFLWYVKDSFKICLTLNVRPHAKVFQTERFCALYLWNEKKMNILRILYKRNTVLKRMLGTWHYKYFVLLLLFVCCCCFSVTVGSLLPWLEYIWNSTCLTFSMTDFPLDALSDFTIGEIFNYSKLPRSFWCSLQLFIASRQR